MSNKLSRAGLTSALSALALVLAPLCTSHARALARAQARVRPSTVAARAAADDPARYVNTFVGTDNDGNTFPGATVPFGMVQWSPDTTRNGFYHYRDSAIRGFSLTHLSGAGCPVYADIPFMPVTEPVNSSPAADDFAAGFSHREEEAAPGFYRVALDNGAEVKLSTTTRTGFALITYGAGREAGLLVNAGGSANGNADSSVEVVGDNELTGHATSGAFCDSRTSYTIYFAAQFDRPFRSFGTWEGAALKPGARAAAGAKAGAFLSFDASQAREVKVKVGLSFVSRENARLNLAAENDGWDFDAVRLRARKSWNDWLGRVGVEGGTATEREVFYTALYHSLISPNVFSDVNGQYAGFDRRTHAARGYTHYANFSDWDTYRTVVQLHALLAPRQTSDMMRSLLADADQSGYLPKWPLANDVTAVMGGDNPVPLIATAYAFGARGFDAHAALGYMLKAATRPGQGIHGYEERPRLAEYLARGYVPLTSLKWDNGVTGSASATLEYATDDFCVARMAGALGDPVNARAFMRRAQNWQNLFDAETGFARPRRASGVFLEGFDPNSVAPHSEVPWDKSSQAGFEEGNSWQYTWMVPHNYAGLFAAVGGREEVVRRLDRFFEKLTGWGHPHFNIANEPSFVSPYAYTWAGVPWRTQRTVRRVMSEIFNLTPAGLPGNDDLGATSAWYVWGALGLYPAVPGVGGFVIGSPLFPAATLAFGDGGRLRIRAAGASAGGLYVEGLTLNGSPYARTWLPLAAVRRGATTTLAFRLSPRPGVAWGARAEDAPPSFTEGQAPAVCFIRGEDSVAVTPGGEAALALGLRLVEQGPLKIGWRAETPPGLELRPAAAGSFEVGAGARPHLLLRVGAARGLSPGLYFVRFKLRAARPGRARDVELPETVLEVRVGPDGAGE